MFCEFYEWIGISSDGKLQGYVQQWHRNGNKKFEGNYVDGKRHGDFIIYKESGEEKFALSHKGWELMTVYSQCIDKNIISRNKSQQPSDKGVKLARGIMSFMKSMNKVGKMAQKFEKSSGGSPRFDTAGMSNYGNTKPRTTGKKGSKTKKRKARSETEFWR